MPTSVAVSVDCDLLELAVPALPCTWCTCFSFPCQQLAALWHHFPAVITPPLDLFALRLFFALSFALVFSFPFLLALALVLTFVLDPANLHRYRTECCRA